MSHFSLLVITDSHPTEADLSKILMPWHQFECTGIDEHIQDIDKTDELRENYQKNTTKVVVAPDGSKETLFDRAGYYRPQYKRPGAESWMSDAESIPAGYKVVEEPTKDYLTIVEFAENYYSSKPLTEGEERTGGQKFGYTLVDGDGNLIKMIDRTNPNYKWDNWSIGGRYSNRLVSKTGANLNQCKREFMDLEAMRKANVHKYRGYIQQAVNKLVGKGLTKEEILSQWKAFSETHDDKAVTESWRAWLAERPDSDFDEFLEAKYKDTPFYIARSSGVLGALGDGLMGACCPDNEPDPYAWAEKAPALTAFAVVQNGEWHEKGKMGWFGMSFNENPDWDQVFNKVIQDLQPSQWLTLVDCHI